MTIRLYAKWKNIPLEQVQVDVRHDKFHAKDCESCELSEGQVDQFKRSITLTGKLIDEDRQKLLVIADKCPVHKTLESKIHITTELA